jgi:hypothetical protein
LTAEDAEDTEETLCVLCGPIALDFRLKLAQMRFYPISTTAIGGDCTRVAK